MYELAFPEFKKDNAYVLSSILDDATLDKISNIDKSNKLFD